MTLSLLLRIGVQCACCARVRLGFWVLSADVMSLHLSSGQEEPSRSKIRQNWDFCQYVLFGTGQSISKAYFDHIAIKNVIKCCLNFFVSIHFYTNLKILLTISRFNCWCSCSVLPDHWRPTCVKFRHDGNTCRYTPSHMFRLTQSISYKIVFNCVRLQVDLICRCPFTGKEMTSPVINIICKHSYDREGVRTLIKQRQGTAK